MVKAVSRVAAAVMLVTAAAAMSDHHPVRFLRSEAALLSADGSLSGSETALILGGTGQPTPSPEFARSAENLYLNPLGFGDGASDSTVCYMDGTDPCSAPLQVLTTPELFQQGLSSLTGASDVTLAVEHEFAANPGAFDADHPLTIFGYSQSATAESIAMTRLADAGIPLNALHFVFIGDPSMPVTGVWSTMADAMEATLGPAVADQVLGLLGLNTPGVIGNVTPNDLYPTTIYNLPTDPVANFTQVFEAKGFWSAVADIFGPHVEYLGLTPEQVADSTTTTDGAITFVNIDDSGINNFDAWISALLDHGVANSNPFQSLFDSLQLLFNNFF